MKKLATGVVTLVMVGLLAGSALAWECWGGGRGYGANYNNYNAESLESRNKFLSETADLRKDLAAKRTQLDAVMSSANPDAEAAGKISREIFDIKEQLRAKADAAGVAGPLADAGYGCQGQGRRGGGNCWR
ncbi:zinc resistance-associated protein [Desulfatibacillum alkenivorans DSM 16219]|jgi:zinc resistance-associated protein|uniref:Zinc resistance-associated protein n=1 Tax=Desulfatibacillum alkenivorans DSM 16219 TaxID=1121393 RepID=A0A1M6VI93_9BACT|nr:hypothetical protein [Desulfatibacillum alkenivorans]SHK80976.1 zinc resistance-associated protein [Desulfatibacillum alkenivorans DSM 16219]